jgi:protein-disulfide isomerase
MLKPPVNDNDHVQGNKNARVELVEYGDYECPHCGRAYPIIKMVQRELGDDLKFIFRNFPISESHPHAVSAALAAEAAALQQKFWEMHDMIYENQDRLEWEHLLGYAKALKLDLNRFKTDVKMKTLSDNVESDFESGVRSGVNGTPSFFVNGKKFNGDWEGEEFPEYLKLQLKAVTPGR